MKPNVSPSPTYSNLKHTSSLFPFPIRSQGFFITFPSLPHPSKLISLFLLGFDFIHFILISWNNQFSSPLSLISLSLLLKSAITMKSPLSMRLFLLSYFLTWSTDRFSLEQKLFKVSHQLPQRANSFSVWALVFWTTLLNGFVVKGKNRFTVQHRLALLSFTSLNLSSFGVMLLISCLNICMFYYFLLWEYSRNFAHHLFPNPPVCQ